MIWNEEEHPCKENGQFTFKNGGAQTAKDITANAAKVFYGESAQKEKAKEEKRGELLYKLKDKLTSAQKLYTPNEELEKMLNEDMQKPLKGGLSNTVIKYSKSNDKKFENDVKDMENNIKKTKWVGLGKIGATIKVGPDAAGMLNLAENKKLPLYTKDSTKLMNINDRKLNEYDKGKLVKFKPYIENKVLNQFKDFGYNLNKIEGRIFKSNSAPVKRIKENDDFKEALIKNKKEILKGENFTKRYTNYGNNPKSNLHNAFGSVDFLNSGFDNNGNLHLYMFDTYDFNKGENAKVEAGRRQMLKGNLKGHFSLHEIILTKQELDEIWNK